MVKTEKNGNAVRILCLVLSLLLVIGLMQTLNVYADEPSTWAKEEIDAAKALNAVTDELTVNYKENLTRAQFVELLVKSYEALTDRVIGISTVKNPFTDADKAYLIKAYAAGIVNGTSATTFSPDMLVTREQMVVMMVRMVEKIEDDMDLGLLGDMATTAPFADQEEISSWAAYSVNKAVASGLVSGVGQNRFDPKGHSTKEQALLVNYRLLLRITEGGLITTPWKENLKTYETDVETVLMQTLGKYEDEEARAFVTADVLNMRNEPDLSNNGNIIRKLLAYEEVVILEEVGDWYKIAATGEMVGYVHSDYIHLYSPEADLQEIRMQIVAYAKQYIGTPYVYGEDSLTDGVDCSGFTGQVMRPFGYVLSRSSAGQGTNGSAVSEADLQPGDLVTYGYGGVISHVAIYIGNGEIIHATVNRGVMITDMRGYLNKPLIGFRQVVF